MSHLPVTVRYLKEVIIECPSEGCTWSKKASLGGDTPESVPKVGDTFKCPLCDHNLLVTQEECY